MKYIATVKGTYRHRVRVKILWFWVVQPWKTTPFTWQREVEAPDAHFAYAPVPGVPISVGLDLENGDVRFSLKVVNGLELWSHSLTVPTGAASPFSFHPWKGIELKAVFKTEPA